LTFDEPVADAAVLLVLASGVRQAQQAERRSETVWEARFVLPDEDLEQVDVQATDLAGNPALIEDAVDLSISRGLPWPGVWAVLLAGVFVAAVRRRHAR